MDGTRRELDSLSDRYELTSKEFIHRVKSLQVLRSNQSNGDVREYLKMQHDLFRSSSKAFDEDKDRLEDFDGRVKVLEDSSNQLIEKEKSLMEQQLRSMGQSNHSVDPEIGKISENFVYPEESDFPSLLEGEHCQTEVENVASIQGNWYYFGRLVLSNYRLIFLEFGRKSVDGSCSLPARILCNVPLGAIDRVEELDIESKVLNFGTKDLSFYSLGFKYSSIDPSVIYDKLKSALQTPELFAFSHGADDCKKVFGDLVSVKEDYVRTGLLSESSGYRLSNANAGYSMSLSYPKHIMVPAALSDDDLRNAAEFRSKGRCIAVVWKFPNGPQVICRSAQPLVGLTRSHNSNDEKHLSLILEALGDQRGRERPGVLICDSRPQTNAVGNIAVGGGWENIEFYKGCDLVFQNIANIHIVRDSFCGLHNLFNIKLSKELPLSIDASTFSRRYNEISNLLKEGKGMATWFTHISSIIQGARQLVEHICHHRGSVLVHCSDGWDRTSQVSSLAQLLLDPYYRTVKGFAVLVEREWIEFGHKFATRFGHSENRDSGDSQRSPVFLQWLDCVFQHVDQYPEEFEFKSRFLVDLMDAVHSCRYGTFLWDSDREREQKGVVGRTKQFWNILDDDVMNLEYAPKEERKVLLLNRFRCEDMRLWIEYFVRWDTALLRRRDLDLKSLF